MGLTPLTSDDLPDGGICTWGRPVEPECGRDVLIDWQQPDTCKDCGCPFPVGHICLGAEDPHADLRRQYGEVLRHWGLLDEIAEPERTEEYAVTDLLAIAHPAAGLSDTQPANDEARTARTQLAELIGYDAHERDAEYEKHVDALIAASLHEAARRMENAGHDDDAVAFLDLLATRQTVEEDETR